MFFPGVRSSNSEFGERTGPNPGSEFGSEKGPGPTLVWQVRSSEKGPGLTLVCQVWSKELPNPGSASSEFGERTGPNPGSEFGERTWPNPGLSGSE